MKRQSTPWDAHVVYLILVSLILFGLLGTLVMNWKTPDVDETYVAKAMTSLDRDCYPIAGERLRNEVTTQAKPLSADEVDDIIDDYADLSASDCQAMSSQIRGTHSI